MPTISRSVNLNVESSTGLKSWGLRAAIRRWGTQGTWALLDQGLFASANFTVYILLARWLSVEQYGGFTVAFSVFLLIGTIHTAVLTEPMLIFGSGRFRERFGDYITILISWHWRLGLILAAPLVICGAGLAAAGSAATGWPIGILSITAPCILFLWLMRRACYARLLPRIAALAGIAYLAAVLILLYLLRVTDSLTAVSALLLIATASAGTAAGIRFRLSDRPADQPTDLLMLEARSEHLRYGRWAVGTSMLSWVPGNVFYFFLPIWWGLEGTAALRAMYNLLLPVLHGIGAIGVLLLPALVRVRGTPDFRRSILGFSAVFVAFAATYWLALVTLGDSAANWLYESQYDGFANLLPVLGLLPFATGLVAVLGGALRAIERPDLVFWAYVASSFTAILVGLPLSAQFGPMGGAAAQVAAAAVTFLGLLLAVTIVRRPS